MTGEPCDECTCVVQRTERKCVVCDAAAPRDLIGPEAITVGGVFLGGVLGILSCALLNLEPGFLALGLGASGGGIVTGLFAQRHLRRFKADPLVRHEVAIRARLDEIDEVLEGLRAVRRRMEPEAHSGSGITQRRALNDSEELFLSHRARYQERLWDVQWARWLKRVDRLAAAWERLSYGACERRLKYIEVQLEAGEALQVELAALDGTPETTSRRERMIQGLDSARELKRGLLGRQAQKLVQRINPLDSERQGALAAVDHQAIQQLAVLSARSELGEFEAGWRELEVEHARVSAELEVARLQRV